MPESESFDLVILGAGSGGYACALRASELGLSVALVERDKLGGTCLHRGCIPTKALLHAAEVADSARDAHQFGINASLNGIDVPAVIAYQQKVITKLFKGLTGLVGAHGVTIVSGEGRLADPHTVVVGDRALTAPNIVLATGSTTRLLPGITVDHRVVLTSDDALALDHVPGRVVVLGGGVIGVEMASVWRSFGAEVTIVEALPHLLPLEDETSSKQLERAFRKRGIAFKLSTRFTSITTGPASAVVALDSGESLEADVVLVAVGRGPVSEGFGFPEAGIAMDRGYVLVDEQCRTNVPGVWAIGDLRPGLQLAHVGFAEGIMVAEAVAGLNPPPIDYDNVPKITYSEPEVASVGLTAAEAARRGIETVTYTYDLAGNGKSQILQTQGSVTLVARPDGPVIGVHMVGSRVGELIAEAQLITNWEALPIEVAQLIHPHPTQSEALGEAHLALAGKPLHAHS